MNFTESSLFRLKAIVEQNVNVAREKNYPGPQCRSKAEKGVTTRLPQQHATHAGRAL